MIVFCCQASLDEPTHTVVMHRTEPTRLQSLALQLSEKVSSLVDNNEKIMEFKQGNYFQKNSKLFLLAARFVVVHLCPPFNYLLSWVKKNPVLFVITVTLAVTVTLN